MSANVVYKILAILLGFGLIIGGFIVFGDAIEGRIRVLDIIVSCAIFLQFVEFFIFPLINVKRQEHKEVGMMGIHMASLNVCCGLSLGLMIFGIINDIPFRFQVMGQLFILFLLLVGRVLTLHSGDKVQEVYCKEEKILAGKISLRNTIDDFMDNVASVKGLKESDISRLKAIQESIRFITPSDNPDAKGFDNQIIQTTEELAVLMRNTSINKDAIPDKISHLERIIAKRKKY